jgi:hypothetical protein
LDTLVASHVTIATFRKPSAAEAARDALREAGIEAWLGDDAGDDAGDWGSETRSALALRVAEGDRDAALEIVATATRPTR